MFTHFLLSVGADMHIPDLTHVKYNVQKNINSLKYCHYKRISLQVIHDPEYEPSRMGIWWDDGRIADIRWYADPRAWRTGDGRPNLPFVYKTILRALENLWEQRRWPLGDLRGLYLFMESEGFFVKIPCEKVLMSPDKQHKVEFICDLYADHADYFLIFSARQNKWRKRIKFLEGHEDPEVFFWFFANREWKDNEQFVLSDRNEEILFIFDVNRNDFAVEYRLQGAAEEREKKMRSMGVGVIMSDGH
jgi:hypothetical protein